MSDAVTAETIRKALRKRHGKEHTGTKAEQWVLIEEARSGAGFLGNNGQCDMLAINTWQSQGYRVIGYEIKVSRNDWRRELDKPEKADGFSRYCHQWYVAMPNDLAKSILHEVPTNWGLLGVHPSGRVNTLKPPTLATPTPIPMWWWIGWLAQIDRGWERKLPRLVAERIAPELERYRVNAEADVAREVQQRMRHLEKDLEVLKMVADAIGVRELRHMAWGSNLRLLGALWPVVSKGRDVTAVVESLHSTARMLEDVMAIDAEEEP